MMPFKEINVLKEVVIMDNKSAFCGRISTDSGIKNGYILTDINSGIIEEVNFSKDMPEFFQEIFLNTMTTTSYILVILIAIHILSSLSIQIS